MPSNSQAGSTVPRRQLGRHLKDARLRARMTTRAAAEALDRAEATLWRIETGRVPTRAPEVEHMCRIYGVSAETTAALTALSRETKARGWHACGDVIPEWFNVYVGLEEAAASIQSYETDLVPGLMQTPDYARGVIRTFRPEMDEAEVERRVELRIARQVLITRSSAPVPIQVVLEESLFRRRVGTPRVLAEQCRRLAELCELPHVDLRIIPLGAPLHLGARTGAFVVLRFPEFDGGQALEPTTVYVEGFTGALYLDQAGEVERYDRAFEDLRRQAGSGVGNRSREILWRLAQEVMG